MTKFVFIVMFEKMPELDAYVHKFCERNSLKLVYGSEHEPAIEEFMNLYKNSSFVITDSFHGLCFAIMFHKNYICYPSNTKAASRFNSIIEMLGLSQKNFYAQGELFPADIDITHDSEDWTAIDKRIAECRAQGLAWIKNALESDCKVNYAGVITSFIPGVISKICYASYSALFDFAYSVYYHTLRDRVHHLFPRFFKHGRCC